MTSLAARPHFRAQLVATQGVTVEDLGACAGAAPATSPAIAVDKFAQSPRPIPSVPNNGLVQAALCAGESTVRGSFVLTLYEVDVAVESPARADRYTSGEGTGQARGPDDTTAPVAVHQTDQIYA